MRPPQEHDAMHGRTKPTPGAAHAMCVPARGPIAQGQARLAACVRVGSDSAAGIDHQRRAMTGLMR